MRPSIRVLLVGLEAPTASLTRRVLEDHELAAVVVLTADDAVHEAQRGRYDCVVFDLAVAAGSAEICHRLRSTTNVPIILLTAQEPLMEGVDGEGVDGLDAGADDYVTKPFSPRELVARIRAQVRRLRGAVGPAVVAVNGLVLDPVHSTVTFDGRCVDLNEHELIILRALAERPGVVLSRTELQQIAELSSERAIDVHVSRLREKLGDSARQAKLVKTIRGAGYVLLA